VLTAQLSIEDINKYCLEEFRSHWKCLENNNQQLWQCRKAERPLNKCVFDNLVRLRSSPCRVLTHFRLCRNWKRPFPVLRRARSPCTCARGRFMPCITRAALQNVNRPNGLSDRGNCLHWHTFASICPIYCRTGDNVMIIFVCQISVPLIGQWGPFAKHWHRITHLTYTRAIFALPPQEAEI
jgi:hypothetical protein